MHLTSLALVVASAALVSAHGRLQDPAPLSNAFAQIGNNCGNAAVKGAPSASFTPGQDATVQWFIQNGDGAGPLQVAFDTTGTGKSFDVKATITQDAPGTNKRPPAGAAKKAHPVTFTVPADLNCPAGGCVMQIRQAGNRGFGSCALVSTGGAAGGAAAGGADAGAAATGGAADAGVDGAAAGGADGAAAGGVDGAAVDGADGAAAGGAAGGAKKAAGGAKKQAGGAKKQAGGAKKQTGGAKKAGKKAAKKAADADADADAANARRSLFGRRVSI